MIVHDEKNERKLKLRSEKMKSLFEQVVFYRHMITHLSSRLYLLVHNKNKGLDPLRSKKTFIRKKEDGPDCIVSGN